jgi:hypothetical protein
MNIEQTEKSGVARINTPIDLGGTEALVLEVANGSDGLRPVVTVQPDGL